MYLVRIEHARCGEYDGVTFIVAPKGLSKEQVEERIELAKNNYLEAYEKFKAEVEKQDPGWNLNIDKFSEDITIKEAKEIFAKQKKEYLEWETLKHAADLRFERYLEMLGFDTIYSLKEDDELTFVESFINWGHRHGDRLRYGDEK